MPIQTLTNPLAAGQVVSDYTTFLDDDDRPIDYGGTYIILQANAAVTKYDALTIVAATTTTPVRVTPVALDVTAAVARRFIGVAQNSADTGEPVKVCIAGISLVNVGDTNSASANLTGYTGAAPAAGVPVVGCLTGTGNAAGEVVGATVGATAEPGYAFGVFLSAEIGSTNTAPMLVRPV